MNPLVLFLPNFRASTTAYLLGIVILAAADYARLQFEMHWVVNLVAMFAILWCVFSIHANRRRFVGAGTGLAALPPGIGLIGAAIGGLVGFVGGLITSMTEFAEVSGIDTSDQQALADAMSDPAFSTAWQTWIESDEEAALALVSGATFPAYLGFWIVIAIFAIWFVQMKRSGGSIDTDAPGTGEADGGSGETD